MLLQRLSLVAAAASLVLQPQLAASLEVDAWLQERLQAIINDAASTFECEMSMAVQSSQGGLVVSAGGAADHDKFVWGSVTKQFTGAALLQAVEAGLLPSLDVPVHPYLDPMLKKLGLGKLSQLFGWVANFITARHLATMSSGVPDYDTATPFPTMDDPFRAEAYATPSIEYTPAKLLNVSWVATGSLTFAPGSQFHYSSTNFVLLGLLLAELHGADSWDEWDQGCLLDALPPARRAMYSRTSFAVHGPPSRYTGVHGYDRTTYNGGNSSLRPGTDVSDIAGVYGGWTASDVTASTADIARFSYDLYGAAAPQLLSPESQAVMVPDASSHGQYGFATFQLSGLTGQSALSPLFKAYGHLGATYGYQSVEAYFPAIDVSLAIASNIETDHQTQPSYAACYAYQALVAAATNTTEAKCTYGSGSYFGKCNCGNLWKCNTFKKQCEYDEHSGYLSKGDCATVCH